MVKLRGSDRLKLKKKELKNFQVRMSHSLLFRVYVPLHRRFWRQLHDEALPPLGPKNEYNN